MLIQHHETKQWNRPATITEIRQNGRSYLVEMLLLRGRRFLKKANSERRLANSFLSLTLEIGKSLPIFPHLVPLVLKDPLGLGKDETQDPLNWKGFFQKQQEK